LLRNVVTLYDIQPMTSTTTTSTSTDWKGISEHGFEIPATSQQRLSTTNGASLPLSTTSASTRRSSSSSPERPYGVCATQTISAPVFSKIPSVPLSVGLMTQKYPFTVTTKHVLLDGILGSHYLNLTKLCLLEDNYGCNSTSLMMDMDMDMDNSTNHNHHAPKTTVDLWIVDLVRLRVSGETFLGHTFTQALLHGSNNPTWKVLLVDYSDQINLDEPKIFKQLGIVVEEEAEGGTRSSTTTTTNHTHGHVRLAISNVVQGRRYNYATNQMELGTRFPIDQWQIGGGPVLHTPYTVRSDVVQAMEEETEAMQLRVRATATTTATTTTKNETHAGVVCSVVHRTHRTLDAIHLWEPNKGSRVTRHAARYRDTVSNRVQAMNGTISRSSSSSSSIRFTTTPPTTLVTSIRVRGELGKLARSQVHQEYAETLLSSKIVVVTQRDNWEDHYRLMEALSSGAMVLSDYMLSLPQGFVHGINIVLFRDVDEMERCIRYYLIHDSERLRIAKHGWHLAMSAHRSWHRLEELLFGCPLTGLDVSCEA
jgi:hypothetical protein